MYKEGRDGLRGYRTLKLGLMPEREALNERIDARCRAMFEGGLADEVRAIQAMGYESVKPFEALGYKQALQSIRGELSLRDALFYAQRNTRRYAKRQITWLRREIGVEWLRGFGETAEIQEEGARLVAEFLAG
jgi:tRNA dimethylallyltransferase